MARNDGVEYDGVLHSLPRQRPKQSARGGEHEERRLPVLPSEMTDASDEVRELLGERFEHE